MEWRLGLEETQHRVEEIYDLICQYRCIADSHCVDFLTEDHWRLLIPGNWKEDLLNLEDSSYLLFPDKLKPSPLKDFLSYLGHLKLLKAEHYQQKPHIKYDSSKLSHFNMSRKKMHEVMNMTEYIKLLSSPLDIKQIVDIGSGKGYLSEYLSFSCKFNVFGIDSQTVNTSGALERCRKVEKYFSDKCKNGGYGKDDSEVSNKSYSPVTCHISWMDDIVDLLQLKCYETFNSDEKTALIGLHTCGDLADVIINQFIKNDSFKMLCLIGCCYHQITSFPMSMCLKKKGAYLCRNSLMLACQSEDRFNEITSSESLQSVFYRAILQVVLVNEMKGIIKGRNIKELCVGRIKKYKNFIDYSVKAFLALEIPNEMQTSDEVLESYLLKHQCDLMKLTRFLQIRVLLGTVIESLLLLDKLLYLLELQEMCGGIKQAWLHQIFSPTISPRCIAVCAYKDMYCTL